MKFYKTYFYVLFTVLAGCDSASYKRPDHLVKHIVYVIEHSMQIGPPPAVNTDTSYLETVFEMYNLVDVRSLDSSIRVKLQYADSTNFLHRDFYDGLKKAYFPCEVATRIANAQYFLKQIDSNLTLIILDAARPMHVQQMMWDSLDMPPDQKFKYLAPPWNTSLHNYGCAVDLSIMNLSTGKLLDMGTDFDHFGKLSEPIFEIHFISTGELSKDALENRKLLRKVMQAAKLNPITTEWWHFNFCSKEYAAAAFKLIK
ncbi:MAG: peptidase vanX D-ala-D-ala dipeptidase [Bacteroidetes bacterium]|nr:peptidase vanX D-ala-D-ala dipeptidase [Bacteroidota bacterium]